MHAVVSHRFFTRFILFFILLSMGAMALDAPYSWYMAERPWLEEFLYVIEMAGSARRWGTGRTRRPGFRTGGLDICR